MHSCHISIKVLKKASNQYPIKPCMHSLIITQKTPKNINSALTSISAGRRHTEREKKRNKERDRKSSDPKIIHNHLKHTEMENKFTTLSPEDYLISLSIKMSLIFTFFYSIS